MAANGGIRRVSPIKPGLKGARNWAAAQIRSAGYSKRTFWRFWVWIIATIFFIIFGALWLGGFMPNAQQAKDNFTRKRLMAMGFVVERIDVTGEGRLRESDVRQALGVAVGDYIFGPDLKSAQKRIESIGWVDHAVVRRLWPNRIVVQIVEREPYALWQNDGNVSLVDYAGHVISTDVSQASYSDYFYIVGEDAAATEFASLDEELSSIPNLKTKFDTAVYYPSGRWDIITKAGGIRVKLPKTDVESALLRLQQIDSQMQILDRKLSQIDMRLPDRLSILPAKETRA